MIFDEVSEPINARTYAITSQKPKKHHLQTVLFGLEKEGCLNQAVS